MIGATGGFSLELPIRTRNLPAGASVVAPASFSSPSTPPTRDQLRAALPSTVDLLYRRRADLIGDATIGDYVALHWLEWNGGALRLTVTGQNICNQIKAETRQANPGDAAAL
jgi:hypothetical protein